MKNVSCHCGKVKLQIKVDDIGKLQRCNCSICRKKGSIMAAVDLNNLEILEGKENLSMYQFNTKVAKHYFCKICGIYTHHQRRSNPNEFAVKPTITKKMNSRRSLPLVGIEFKAIEIR